MDKSETISFQIEGLDSEEGHVRLEFLLDKLRQFKDVLTGIDKLVGGTAKPALYYRVVDLSHSSPIKIELEPVVRDKKKRRNDLTRKAIVGARKTRLFEEFARIRRREAPSPEVDTSMLRKMETLVQGRGKQYKSALLSSGDESFPIDSDCEIGLHRMLDLEEVSFGAYEGKLETADLHQVTNNFWIYPVIGPERVWCHAPPGFKDKIKRAMLQYVKVVGKKYYRPGSNFPYRIECRDFEIQKRSKEDVSLLALKGAAEGFGQEREPRPSKAFAHEWE